MKTEKPILFSGPMVRAILEGRKTQTRRVVKGQEQIEGGLRRMDTVEPLWCELHADEALVKAGDDPSWKCPYGKPGDGLWVRENFWISHDSEFNEATGAVIDWGVNLKEAEGSAQVCYEATPLNPEMPDKPGQWEFAPPDDWDGESALDDTWGKFWVPWGPDCCSYAPRYFSKRPSIHMPRWASRIDLEITGLRVERLQDISEADAIAEGIEFEDRHDDPLHPGDTGRYWKNYQPQDGLHFSDPVRSYRSLWESINGSGSWDLNPWLWVIEFKRVEGRAA